MALVDLRNYQTIVESVGEDNCRLDAGTVLNF